MEIFHCIKFAANAFCLMTPKQLLALALDRPGLRPILAFLATQHARRILQTSEAFIYHTDIWNHSIDGIHLPDGPRFEYSHSAITRWKREISKIFKSADDFWFTYYRPEPGSVIVDVGAGRGEDVLPFSIAVGNTGKVLAIEAHPLAFRSLTKICELNRLHNVTAVNCAASDAVGQVTISDLAEWESNSISSNAGIGYTVQSATLDQICAEYGIENIDFLKMNIEGAEVAALQGMSRLIQKTQHLCICCHDFRAERGEGEYFRTRALVEKQLVDYGFTVVTREDDKRAYVRDHIHGSRNSRTFQNRLTQ